MPIYEYKCGKCHHKFDMIRHWSERGDKAVCPICANESKPQVSSPSLGNMDNLGRTK